MNIMRSSMRRATVSCGRVKLVSQRLAGQSPTTHKPSLSLHQARECRSMEQAVQTKCCWCRTTCCIGHAHALAGRMEDLRLDSGTTPGRLVAEQCTTACPSRRKPGGARASYVHAASASCPVRCPFNLAWLCISICISCFAVSHQSGGRGRDLATSFATVAPFGLKSPST